MINEFNLAASWAVHPEFYHAPYPKTADGSIPSEYQHAAAEYALARDHVLLADEPGTGKTVEAILIDNAIESRATLVVCPASLRLNWEREIWKWSSRKDVTTSPILKSRDGVSLVHDYVIVSYALLRNDAIFEALTDRWYDHLICDECHAFKDYKGNATSNRICGDGGLKDFAGRMTLASGTPMPNGPMEIYNVARLLDWDSIDRMGTERFRNYYFEEGGGFVRGPVLVTKDKRGQDCEPYYANKVHWSETVRNKPRRMGELQDRLRGHFMVRRLKEHVLDQLPEQKWHPFPLVVDGDIRQAMAHPGWAEAERLYDMDPDEFVSAVPVDGAISTAMRKLGEAKVPAVADYIEELLSEGVEKLVVGAWHVNGQDGELGVLPRLRKRLEKYGLVYMDGGTTPRRKQDAVDEFQSNPKIRIILGQMKTLGEGWTLTAAQDVVCAEFYWVAGVLQQFFDRISRRGQQGAYTLGHLPIVPNSLEERMMNRVIEKDLAVYEALDKPR